MTTAGETLHGIVASISPGIARGNTNRTSGLEQTKPENNWVALAQRIPVMITFTDLGNKHKFIVGSSVIVDIESAN